MLSDFEVITKQFPQGQDIIIYPIADVHLGSKECMLEEWQAFCKHVQDTPNAYIIIGGDLLDNCTRNSVGNVFEMGMRPSEAKKLLAQQLEPIKDRILCAVPGNHECRKDSQAADDNALYDVMCKLDIEDKFRPNVCFLKIVFNEGIPRDTKCRKYVPCYTFVVTHGSGGGTTFGAPVNKGNNFGYTVDNMDCLILGHTHKPFTTQPQKIVFDTHNDCVTFKPFKVVCCTSWLQWGGYAASKMLIPASHDLQTITLSGNHKKLTVTM